ncbi:RabGAP/TBC [Meredithblackwellia eburnea MCA 4105]
MDTDDQQERTLIRPAPDQLIAQWNTFFQDPLLSLTHLKNQAVHGLVPHRGLRSLHWRYFFSLLPSPSTPTAATRSTYAFLLTQSRSEYAELRDRFLKSPDGTYVNDGDHESLDSAHSSAPPGKPSSLGHGDRKQRSATLGVQVNNPLSQEPGNLWSTWFDDLELRRTIRQDVKRTFPEIDYFRQPETQDKMTDLLFIFCKLCPEIGYRQGMHELLAPFLWTVDYDSLPTPDSTSSTSTSSLAHLVLSREHVEHDAWSLFSTLMKSARALYDHASTIALPANVTSASASTTSLTLNHASSSSSPIVLVQPIVATAIRIHDRLLQTIDPPLWAKMEKLRVEPQLYAIRWLRLLFSREFPIDDTLMLWDGLFAEDPTLRLMDYVCVAMLERIRDALLLSDYSGFLQLLLRYPSPKEGGNRVDLLLQQAILLRDNVSEAAGEACRAENIKLGLVAGEGTGEDDEDTGRVVPRFAAQRGHRKAASVNPQVGVTAASLFAEGGGLVGDLAKGVYGRAEALGINKALFGTLNEIRRGVNGATAPPTPKDHLSEIPSRLPWDKPATPVRDYLGEIARLKASNMAMSKAVGLCIDVFERELIVSKRRSSQEEDHPPSREALMAATALKHVRDVLAGYGGSFDPNVLSPLLNTLDDSGIFPNQSPPSPEIAIQPHLSPTSTVPTLSKQAVPSSDHLSATSMTRSLSASSNASSNPPPPPSPDPEKPSRIPPTSSASAAPPSANLRNSISLDRPLPARPMSAYSATQTSSSWDAYPVSFSRSFARLADSTSSGGSPFAFPLGSRVNSSSSAVPLHTAYSGTQEQVHQVEREREDLSPPPLPYVRRSSGGALGQKEGRKTAVIADPLGAMS